MGERSKATETKGKGNSFKMDEMEKKDDGNSSKA